MKFDNEQLLKYIGACTSPYHTVDTSLQMLLDSGFTELSLEEEWQLDSGSYVVNVFGTTLFAFHIGKKPEHTLRIASAHTDFPAIRVKPNPITSVKGYTKLNVEMYGGLIENTWWKPGFFTSVINLIIFMGLGSVWMKLIGMW